LNEEANTLQNEGAIAEATAENFRIRLSTIDKSPLDKQFSIISKDMNQNNEFSISDPDLISAYKEGGQIKFHQPVCHTIEK
jgi:hypothetical protein